MTILERTIKLTEDHFGVPHGTVSATTKYLGDLGSALADEGALIKDYNDEFGTSMTKNDAGDLADVGAASQWIASHGGQ